MTLLQTKQLKKIEQTEMYDKVLGFKIEKDEMHIDYYDRF